MVSAALAERASVTFTPRPFQVGFRKEKFVSIINTFILSLFMVIHKDNI